eukprot:6491318-Amphidinium_carterae.1
MDAGWLGNLLDSWQVVDRRPTPGEYTQAGLLARTARVLCCFERPAGAPINDAGAQEQIRDLKSKISELEGKIAEPPAVKRIKLSQVLDQNREDEIAPLKNAEVVTAYARYVEVMGSDPSPDETPTSEQLASIKHVVSLSCPPFADFAIFVPNASRLVKKMKLGGMSLRDDGTFVHEEIKGPATFELWKRCYKVWRTTVIELDIICPGHADMYCDKVERLHTRYGASVWHLLYQADVRARLERSHLTHQKLLRLAAMGGSPQGFDVNRPWNYIWKDLAEDSDWWRDQFIEIANQVLTHVRSLGSSLDGDVVAGTARAPQVADPRASTSTRSLPPPQALPAARIPQSSKRHELGEDGLLQSNRRGIPLCKAFQTGECTSIQPGTTMICGRDASRVHQCGKCLMPGHGAN